LNTLDIKFKELDKKITENSNLIKISMQSPLHVNNNSYPSQALKPHITHNVQHSNSMAVKSLNNVVNNIVQSHNALNWADRAKESLNIESEYSSTDNDKGFTEVNRKSKKRKTTSTPPQASTNPVHIAPQNAFPRPTKIVGTSTTSKKKLFGTSTTSKLKSSKVIDAKIMKKAFYVGNVSLCNKEVIENHLKENEIEFNFVYPVFRRKANNASTLESQSNDATPEKPTKSTAFKIILPESEVTKLMNVDIWDCSTFLYEWDFNKSSNHKPASNKNG